MEGMTGDGPQPGETPRSEPTLSTWADPGRGAFFQGPELPEPIEPAPAPAAKRTKRQTKRQNGPANGATTLEPPAPAEHTGEAAEAHEAGVQDASAGLGVTGAPAPPPALDVPDDLSAEGSTRPKPRTRTRPARTGPPPADKQHDRVDQERFNIKGTTTSYVVSAEPEPVPAGPEPTIVDLLAALPADDPAPAAAPPAAANGKTEAKTLEGEAVETGTHGEQPGNGEEQATPVPEIMILPEPERNRPTVALERGPVPGQNQPTGKSRLGRARQDWARADRALQDRVRAERTAALLETSPFWKPEEERAPDAAWPSAATREKLTSARTPRPKIREPRRPAAGLLALVALGLVAAFFSWVSAEPFWLAVGHGQRGTATVAQCSGSGIGQRCSGSFTPTGGAYLMEDVALLGVRSDQQTTGTMLEARMVSPTSRQAYAGETGLLVQLRWMLGFVLVVACGLAIAWLTGARRLESREARRTTLIVSLAGPLLLLAGFLAVTY